MKHTKMWSVLLALTLVLGLGIASASAEDVPNVVLAVISGSVPADVQLVEDAMNEILREKIGVTVTIRYFTYTDFTSKMNLILASQSEQMDIIPVMSGNWSTFVSSGKLLDMTEVYEEYGAGVREYLDDKYLEAGIINGKLYGIPAIYAWSSNAALLMRTDVLEKAGLDEIPEEMSIYELTDIFDKIWAVDSSMPLLGVEVDNSIIGRYKPFDPLTDGFGVLMDNGQSLTVENWYATDEYAAALDLVRGWNEAGYIVPDSEITTDTGATMVRNGLGAGWIGIGDPGSLPTQISQTGYDLTMIQLTKPVTTTASVGNVHWSLPVTCQDTASAMKVINEMYCNQQIVDLLDFGVEGVHYNRVDDVLISLPEGVTAETSGYFPHVSWYIGNQFISSVWDDTGRDFNVLLKDYAMNSDASLAMGYTFDNAEFSAEIAALTNARDQYVKALGCGVVDPEVVLPQLLKALEDAGINDVIAAKQEQLDAWLAEKSE